ncbi:ribokinase [Vibrio splendidus ZS-139]|nr:ribokinase [Vibrio splendidus ZS-139]
MRLEQSLTSNLGALYVLGSYNVDIVSEVKNFPKVGETICATSTAFYSGGKGTNQATAASKVSNKVHFCTKVGQDSFTNHAKEHLNSTSLASLSLYEHPVATTGNAFIMLSEKTRDNMITLDLGANLTITKQEIENEAEKLNNSNVLLVQLENNIDAVSQTLQQAKEQNVLTILNPAPYSHEVTQLLQWVDVITPNETEAESLTGIEVMDIESAEKAAKAIHSKGLKLVVITLGSKGCLVYDGFEFKRYLSYSANVVDTCGAGDSFNGALAASLSNGISVRDSINYANAFASLAVERKGASSMPEDREVRHRMKQQR